jgi:hypothetical protein
LHHSSNPKKSPWNLFWYRGGEYFYFLFAGGVPYALYILLLISIQTTPFARLARHSAKNQYQKLSIKIFREKELRSHSPNFRERFIYTHDRFADSAAGNMWTDPWNI